MDKDPRGINGIINKLEASSKILKNPTFAQSYGVEYWDLAYDTMQQLCDLHLTNARDVFVKCEEALNRIGALDFSMPVEVDDSNHVGNYVAHSLNMLMEELASRVFPFQQEVIDGVSDLVIVTNQRGYIQRVNKRVKTLTQFKEEEILDKPVSELLYPNILELDLKSGFTLTDINISIKGKKKIIPVTLTVTEVKGFRNLTQGFTFIAQTQYLGKQ